MLIALGSIPIFMFHFLMSFPQREETMLVDYVSHFNDLYTKKRNYDHIFCLIF
jgi:hypothetical protein